MELFRKIMLILGTAAFAVCSLFLNGLAGAAIITVGGEQYKAVGILLLVSTGAFLAALITAYGRKVWTNILSLVLNGAATLMFAMPINALNSLSDSAVPKEAIDRMTSRIYPSVAVTLFLALAVIGDIMSEKRIDERERRRSERIAEKNRSLHEDEKIV